MKFLIDTEYVAGHLRYGYYEYDIPDNMLKEWEEYINLEKLSQEFVLSETEDNRLDELNDLFSDYRKLIVSDYEIDDIGPLVINSLSNKS